MIPSPPKKIPPVQERILTGKGNYTEILAIYAPSSSQPGSYLTVSTDIKNLYAQGIYIAASAVYNGSQLTLLPDYAAVNPGVFQNFYGSFIMPNSSISLKVYSWYWTGQWVFDDQKQIIINISTEEAQFQSLSVSYAKA